MEHRLLTDFDVEISRVILAHHDTMGPERVFLDYVHGRITQGMACVLSGCGEFAFSDGRNVRISGNSVALIPSGLMYRLRPFGDEPFDHYAVNFIGDNETLPNWIPRTEMHVIKPKDFAWYHTGFEEMVHQWRRMRTGYRMQTKARLMSVMAEYLTESMAQSVDPAAYSRTLPAKWMMDARYAVPLTLREMAEACGMCEGSFRRAFTSVYNHSPVAYLLNLRIEKAKEFLMTGVSIENTAQMTGFSDTNYFIRYFRKITGLTPGRYRQL